MDVSVDSEAPQRLHETSSACRPGDLCVGLRSALVRINDVLRWEILCPSGPASGPAPGPAPGCPVGPGDHEPG